YAPNDAGIVQFLRSPLDYHFRRRNEMHIGLAPLGCGSERNGYQNRARARRQSPHRFSRLHAVSPSKFLENLLHSNPGLIARLLVCLVGIGGVFARPPGSVAGALLIDPVGGLVFGLPPFLALVRGRFVAALVSPAPFFFFF